MNLIPQIENIINEIPPGEREKFRLNMYNSIHNQTKKTNPSKLKYEKALLEIKK